MRATEVLPLLQTRGLNRRRRLSVFVLGRGVLLALGLGPVTPALQDDWSAGHGAGPIAEPALEPGGNLHAARI